MASGEVIYIQYSDLEYPIESFFLMINEYNNTKADVIFGERYDNLNIKKNFRNCKKTTILRNIFNHFIN